MASGSLTMVTGEKAKPGNHEGNHEGITKGNGMMYKLFACILALSCVTYSASAEKTGAKIEGWFNTSKTWGGTIQGSNSRYTERDTIPLRFTGNFVPGTTHTLLLKYDFADSSGTKHFFDSLGTFNATVTNVSNFILTNGIAVAPTSSNVWALLKDTSPALPTGAQTPGYLTTYGIATLTTNGYTMVNGIKVLSLSFKVAGSGTTAVPVVIGYGGHLATEIVWGMGGGASKWPGASGKQYASIDGSSDLNVSVNPGAIIPSADLSLTVTASPQPPVPGGNITYTITVGNSGPDQATSVKVTNTLPAGVTFPWHAVIAGSQSSSLPPQSSCHSSLR